MLKNNRSIPKSLLYFWHLITWKKITRCWTTVWENCLRAVYRSDSLVAARRTDQCESAAIKLRITGQNALYKHLERKKKLKKCSETYLSTLVDIFLHGVNCNCYLQQANAKRHIKSGPKKIYHDKIQRRRLVTWLHSGITSFEDECHVILWWWSWIRSSRRR